MPTLTVFCPYGLSNRLRVLLSGLVLAEASGRQFKMLWPITPDCAAPFDALFDNAWPVETTSAEAVADLPYISGWFGQMPDLLAATEPDLIVGHPALLTRSDKYPGHRDLELRCKALLDQMQPIPEIRGVIDAFREAHFRPAMIGVHIRRGDLVYQRPDAAGDPHATWHLLDRALKQLPEAGIMLSTDDGAVDPQTGRGRSDGVRDLFARHYGSRVIWTAPRSLDRRTTEAVQDAVVDLWLLRSTDYIIGTAASSFSQLAIWGRDVPHQMLTAGTAGYRRMEWLARRTGLYATIRALGRRQFGRDLPFPVLVRYYRGSPLRIAQRVMRRVAQGSSHRIEASD
ncbi:MAG: hypothetical protein GX620_16700 [Chloroflexi bacterium]|mgnify:CR=1 FL=1|nr:hypothetical protein [Chloroflexota bacterium]